MANTSGECESYTIFLLFCFCPLNLAVIACALAWISGCTIRGQRVYWRTLFLTDPYRVRIQHAKV